MEMITLTVSFIYSALVNLFENQPDLSQFTSETNEREPNLSFHLANELSPYFFWLQCDFDVTKVNLGNQRPDIIFHRRGTNIFNFLVVEVKRASNRQGNEMDVLKINDVWFSRQLNYRLGASVIIDEEQRRFAIHVFENKKGSEVKKLTVTDKTDGQYLNAIILNCRQNAIIQSISMEAIAADRAGDEKAAEGVKEHLDEVIFDTFRFANNPSTTLK